MRIFDRLFGAIAVQGPHRVRGRLAGELLATALIVISGCAGDKDTEVSGDAVGDIASVTQEAPSDKTSTTSSPVAPLESVISEDDEVDVVEGFMFDGVDFYITCPALESSRFTPTVIGEANRAGAMVEVSTIEGLDQSQALAVRAADLCDGGGADAWLLGINHDVVGKELDGLIASLVDVGLLASGTA